MRPKGTEGLRTRRRRSTPALAAIIVSAVAGGCASPTLTRVPVGDYHEAFRATTDVLREFGFELDRVDAERGVVTTRPRASAGWATPWLDHARGVGGATRGLLQHERRVATVRFDRASGPPLDELDGRTEADVGPLAAVVEVRLQRISRPRRTADPTSIRFATQVGDPALAARGLQPRVVADVGADPALAARLAEAILERADTGR